MPASQDLEVPIDRVHGANDAPLRPKGDYVLYWMIAQRRLEANFGLQHAIARATELGRPLLVFEPLRAGSRWASARTHAFVIDGMADNAARAADAGVRYLSYVEPTPGDGQGLLAELASRACLVVTDEYPCFFLPAMVEAAARALDVRLETVDANGLLPLRASDRAFPTAYSFRRHLQKTLPDHLGAWPIDDPLPHAAELGRAKVARDVLRRSGIRVSWDGVDADAVIAALPIDHQVGRVPEVQGGASVGWDVAVRFLDERLARYADDRNQPQEGIESGLSPYLHFGHVGVHSVVGELLEQEGWDPGRLAAKANGKREGWWGMSQPAESFLDEIVTWREVGYVFCHQRLDDYDRYESLPDWARATLDEHADDPREYVYTLDEFARSETHDELWNAAQRQLVREGKIHNYLRMLWGKKIVEWTESPQQALEFLIELNNRYALDGRDPNSYSGIFWVLGRFDRPWAPIRPVFGSIRWMSSQNTARKVRVKDYIARYSAQGELF